MDCEVKHSRYGDGFEVVLKSMSEIQESANPQDVHKVLFDNEISFARNSTEITLQLCTRVYCTSAVAFITIALIRISYLIFAVVL